jgi:hypothetical protein
MRKWAPRSGIPNKAIQLGFPLLQIEKRPIKEQCDGI